MKTNRSTIKRPCSQPQGFSDPQKSYIRETSYFHIFDFPRVFHPPSEHPQQPYPFLDPRKIQHTGNPIFSKNFNFQNLHTSREITIFKHFSFHRDSLYTISLYKLLYYYSTFSQEWVGKYILTYQGKEGGILHLTYQGKEVGILHLTYQRKQYIAIYSKTLSQSLLFTNRIHTLHLTLYGKLRETKTHYIYSKVNSHSMSSFFKDKGPLLLRENRPTQGRYFTTKRATLCPSVLRTKDLFF